MDAGGSGNERKDRQNEQEKSGLEGQTLPRNGRVLDIRFVIGGQVPNVSYLTRIDYFILGYTVLVFGALVLSVVTGAMAKANKISRAERIDRWCRVIFPGSFAGVLLYSFFF